jgi:hypothetical protein
MSDDKNEEVPAIILPATIKASGSDKTIEIDPAKWADRQGFLDYLLGYACGVILQRASAGKNDDAEKAAKAVNAAIERLMAGIVPAGGGFTKLTPEEYAMKETLMASKVKFEKGESVADVLNRLAVKLTEEPEVADDATDEDLELAAEVYTELCVDTQAALETELQSSEVYKSALKARKAKAKTATVAGSLMGKL